MLGYKKPFRLICIQCLIIITWFFPGCSNDIPKTGIIPNPSFEAAEGASPQNWRESKWGGAGSYEYADEGYAGNKSVILSSDEGADISWSAVIPVKPFSKYRLSGWIKTENLEAGSSRGALFNLHGIRGAETQALTGTNDWTEVEMEFDTDANDAVRVNCLFGGWGRSTGRAWYDDLSLTLLSSRELDPSIVIKADKTGTPISKYIYGQFIEHLGRCIYGGIWAEMLEDRKFYYPPGDKMSPWDIVDGQNAVKMITADSYVGDHTPEIQLTDGDNPHGIVQDSLGLISGKGYTGRIIIAGSRDAAPVEISLVWGRNSGDRQTIVVDEMDSEYTKIPLNFTSGKTTDLGRLEIVSRGSGVFKIGTVSLMPDDNVNGFRSDVLNLLKELDSPVYRWPGGNFVSGYDWKDGLGDRDKRPPRKNPAWKGVEHNDVGIHEFIDFCREIDTEPFVTVNSGLGDVKMAVGEVEYANGAINTPMGKLRAENGAREPFNVKWWAVGNEMYGGWQLGHMPLSEYVKKHNLFADAMLAVDPGIKLIAVGSVGRWDEEMLANCADHMDLISEHFYCQERPGLMAHVMQPSGHIKRISDAMREYRSTIPELEGKDIRIAMDEWNFWYGPHVYGELGTRYFLKDALGIAAGLHEYYKNSDIIYMANYAQTVNVIGCIKTNKTTSEFETTGLALKLYRSRYGTIPVEITGAPEPLNVAAAWSDDRRTLTIGIVNPTREEVEFPVRIENAALSGDGKLWLIAGRDEMAYNEPGKDPAVEIEELPIGRVSFKQDAGTSGASFVFKIKPISISLYELVVK
ncbi:alpha-L-arabinofuranosidase C-terminal domain-containing protein [candidate division KSB1 bacterium]